MRLTMVGCSQLVSIKPLQEIIVPLSERSVIDRVLKLLCGAFGHLLILTRYKHSHDQFDVGLRGVHLMQPNFYKLVVDVIVADEIFSNCASVAVQLCVGVIAHCGVGVMRVWGGVPYI
jgi:hypothetical protein